MGILLNKQEQKRLFLIEELQMLGVSKTRDGEDIHLLEYDELKQLLALTCLLRVDIEADSNKYF